MKNTREEKMQEGREEREETRGRADTGTNRFLLFQHWGKPDGHGAPALGGSACPHTWTFFIVFTQVTK